MSEEMVHQLLWIVARDQPDLYEYLSRRFSGVQEVRVILDRRHTERRTFAEPYQPERRRAERRSKLKDALLRSQGLVVVRLE